MKGGWLYEPDHLISRRVVDVIDESERPYVTKAFSSVISEGAATSIETRILKADGSTLDVLWSMTWSAAEKALFCVVFDNSQRKEVERLKQSFVQMVTHDLRSPLTSMLGTLHILQANQDAPLPEEALSKVERMERVTDRLLKLVNDLLEVESLGKGKENYVCAGPRQVFWWSKQWRQWNLSCKRDELQSKKMWKYSISQSTVIDSCKSWSTCYRTP